MEASSTMVMAVPPATAAGPSGLMHGVFSAAAMKRKRRRISATRHSDVVFRRSTCRMFGLRLVVNYPVVHPVIPPEVWCFRYVVGVQIPSQDVIGCLGYMKL